MIDVSHHETTVLVHSDGVTVPMLRSPHLVGMYTRLFGPALGALKLCAGPLLVISRVRECYGSTWNENRRDGPRRSGSHPQTGTPRQARGGCWPSRNRPGVCPGRPTQRAKPQV